LIGWDSVVGFGVVFIDLVFSFVVGLMAIQWSHSDKTIAIVAAKMRNDEEKKRRATAKASE